MQKKFLFYTAIGLTALAWLKTGWQLAVKLPPAQRMRYKTAGNWKDNGYPHGSGPRIIDGHRVWAYSMYGNDYQGKQSGFIRYNMKTGMADMLWPFPGNSRYARITAFARHPSGKIAVLWSPHLAKKTRLDLLKPSGGLQPLGTLPVSRANLRTIGMFWTGNRVTIARGHYQQKKTFLYTHIKPGRWKEQIIRWPGNYRHRTMPHLARYKNGKWETVFSDWILKRPDRPEPVTIYSFTQGDTRAVILGKVNASSRETFHLVDGSPGNLTGGFLYFRKQHLILNGNSLIRFVRPANKSGRMLETLRDTLRITSRGNLSRLIYIRNRFHTGMSVQWKDNKIDFQYKRASRARRRRKAALLAINGATNPNPVIESFRFAGSMVVPVPAGNGSFWLLGTFGYFFKVDKAGNRIDAPGPCTRFLRLFKNFSGRSSAYDDFYNELEVLKSAALLYPLFGLPLLLLILLVIRKIGKPSRVKFDVLMTKTATLHILLSLASAWWFWRIITEI